MKKIVVTCEFQVISLRIYFKTSTLHCTWLFGLVVNTAVIVVLCRSAAFLSSSSAIHWPLFCFDKGNYQLYKVKCLKNYNFLNLKMESIDNYPLCLICSLSLSNQESIKLETFLDDHDDKSVIIFLLSVVLEIPQRELVHLQNQLINQSLNTSFCEPCTKIIYTAKHIHTEILEISQKFRKIQKQIVQQISNTGDLPLVGDTTLSTSNREGLLEFCRNFINKRKVHILH